MKVFISMPMSGKTDAEIEEEFEKISNRVMSSFPNVQVIDSVIHDYKRRTPLENLAISISFLAQADAAYFAPNWDKYRGCQIERKCCEEYGVEILGVKKNDWFSKQY